MAQTSTAQDSEAAGAAFSALAITRWLLIAIIPAIFVSTSAAVALELICYVLFASIPELRSRLYATLRRPVSIALLVFAAVVIVSSLHGVAPWKDQLGSVNSSRRLLLFFLAAAVFDSKKSKDLAISVVLVGCMIAALVSYVSWFSGVAIKARFDPGIVLLDHTAQGMIFAVGVGICIVRGLSIQTALGTLLLVSNIAFVTPGRNGYLALIVIVCSVCAFRASKRTLVIGLACLILLSASPQVWSRLKYAADEFRNFATSEKLSDMGWRIVMWENALRIIGNNPIIGSGTGSFETAYSNEVAEQSGWRATITNDPHNQYLKIWAEQGAIGLIAFLVFIVFALRSSSSHRDLAVAVLLAWCVCSAFNSYFSRFAEGRFIFLWVGAMLAAPRMSQKIGTGPAAAAGYASPLLSCSNPRGSPPLI